MDIAQDRQKNGRGIDTTAISAARVFASADRSRLHNKTISSSVQIILSHYFDIYYNVFIDLGAHKSSKPKNSSGKSADSWVIKPKHTETQVVAAIDSLDPKQLTRVINTLRYLSFSPYAAVKQAVERKLEKAGTTI